ncbi:unnamed protein product [Meloidogyne enterolobii]|uniref:Uncharacterized protein n=2 Tax=Meloidogyne enterolobii TaxID=390850 RepID=A0ACB0XQP5_MELEN
MESKKKTNRGRRGSKRNSEFRGEKPKDTYIELIGEAIEKKDSKRSTLEEIVSFKFFLNSIILNTYSNTYLINFSLFKFCE